MGNTEKTAKAWGKKEWIFLVVALLAIVLLWNLIPYVYGLISGKQAYEKVKNFQPSEETYITILMSTRLPDGDYRDGGKVEITNLEQQKAITILTSQLEHDGHYAKWGHMPLQKNRLDPPWGGDGNSYTIILRPQNVNEYGYIQIAFDRCMGISHSNQYPPKYDNYEPLFQYCEDLFEGIKTSN